MEKALDLALRGKAGGQKVEVDSVGRVVREDPAGDIRPTPGAEVMLTLDADIQNRALEVFGEDSGAAVMMDCRKGDVLCMVSAPSFDANAFVKGMDGQTYAELAKFERKPLFNKALTATYPPGSTFKTMVTLAALRHGYDPATVHVCGKHWFWGGRSWGCDKAHGALNLHQAVAASCDIYFYQLALTLGPTRMAEVARELGLGSLYDIGIPGQKAGLVPDPDYKRKHFPHDPVWHAGETPSMGIGQGYNLVNCLQLATLCARIANGGHAVTPRLIHKIGDELQASTPPPPMNFLPEHIQFVQAAMTSVVNDPGGTAFESHAGVLDLGPLRMAGKTGTAQSHNYNGGRGQHGAVGDWKLRDHAWFIAFAPVDSPRYAMAVLTEHGGMGASASAPKAREIMKVALLKDPEIRARVEQPLPGDDGAAQPAPAEGGVGLGGSGDDPTDPSLNDAGAPA